MRQAYAHDAVPTMDPAGDVRAPGGAITLALCGSWQHEPPCPLAAHHTSTDRAGAQLRLRVLFATEPGHEQQVRLLSGAARSPEAPAHRRVPRRPARADRAGGR